MRITTLATLLAALLAGPATTIPAAAGTLTLENQTTNQHYCAVFDLWSFSGPKKHHLPCAPGETARFEAPTLDAIGKIAVYQLPPNTPCDHTPQIPDARNDPGGILLPSRDFLITIHPNATVTINERD